MAIITNVNGTSGNDVMDVHRGDMYQAGKLVLMASGSFADGTPPFAALWVNGVRVVEPTPVWATSWSGKSQEISYTIPAGTVVTSIAVEYTNDLFRSTTEDRNLYVNSLTLNGVDIPLSSGTYTPEAHPQQAGERLIAWNGPLSFSGPAITNAMNADVAGRNLTVDGGAGIDTIVYGGRASLANVSFSGGNIVVSSKANEWGADTLVNVERVLFDDKSVHGAGGGAGITQDGNNRTIFGGSGIDTVVYNGAKSDYTITRTSGGNYVVTHNGASDADVLIDVERLMFSDANVAVDIDGNGGQAYRLYQAAFNRAPDLAGLGFQMRDLDDNLMLWQVARNFLNSPEFQATYGNLSNQQYVETLYHNVLHRDGESAGVTFHTNNLNNGLARHDLLVQFSESPENQANVIGAIETGMVYTI